MFISNPLSIPHIQTMNLGLFNSISDRPLIDQYTVSKKGLFYMCNWFSFFSIF